ncbi:MAG: hypothetical protein AAF603_05690, partial [Pseudomonadota bacterium]
MTDTRTEPARKLDGTEKLAVEMGPLAAFFIGFFFHERLAPFVDQSMGTVFLNQTGHELYLSILFFLPVFG